MPPIRKPAFPAKAGRKRGAFELAAGWTALALFIFVQLPAGLGLAALVGSFDRNHEIQVRSGERGLALVLHHGRNCAVHRHGAIAQVLTCFAQRASATDPDHVIQFGAADTLSPKAQLAVAPLQCSEQPVVGLTEPVVVSGEDAAQHFALPRSRPPPGEWGLALCLRSTVLLI